MESKEVVVVVEKARWIVGEEVPSQIHKTRGSYYDDRQKESHPKYVAAVMKLSYSSFRPSIVNQFLVRQRRVNDNLRISNILNSMKIGFHRL